MVSVLIVTYNSEKFILRCLESIARQSCAALEIIVVDNASKDSTVELLSKSSLCLHVIRNQDNAGFAAAQNQAIRRSKGEWLLCLNPDAVLRPEFITNLVALGTHHPQVGSLCGKLLRWQPDAQPEFSDALDSTGMYFTRNLRHFDRGGEMKDVGQYAQPEYVFGASGAAVLFRREAVEDLSFEGQFFDEDFFAYREDADLAWRAQIFGWECLYCPTAIGWHVRRVTPSRFSQLPLFINWHSVKNRFLMRVANISPRLYLRLFIPTTSRDLLIVGYCLLRDWRLLSALLFPLTHARRLLRKRRWVQAHRKISDQELAFWFHDQPRSQPVSQPTGMHRKVTFHAP